jgi:hypothetical protein
MDNLGSNQLGGIDMTTDTLSNVEAWFNSETAKGLVDIKLCISPGAEVSV